MWLMVVTDQCFNIHRKGKNAIKNKTNTVPNRTTNPNPTIDKAGKRKEVK